MKLMLRALLGDRFKLKLRPGKKEISAYVITLGKNPPRLSAPKEGEARSLRVEPRLGEDQKPASYHVVGTRFSLTQLCDTFSRQMGRVILNNTGLDGDFDFALDLTPNENQPSPLDPSLLLTAMREQLGLTVKTQNAPVDYYVVEGAEKVVAGN
jgi:uncharacterized protein (TIGR03435 family)